MWRRLQYWLIRRSVKKYGVQAPILVTEDGLVIDGNNRVAAALELGLDVPVFVVRGKLKRVDPRTLTITCPPDKR